MLSLQKKYKLQIVSKMPGRTQQIFFISFQRKFFLVDLPGYGYAAAPKDKMREFQQLALNYIRDGPNRPLKKVAILIDCRRGVQSKDLNVMDLCEKVGVPYMMVLTKIDRLSPQKSDLVQLEIEDMIKGRKHCFTETIKTSSKDRVGIDHMKAMIILSAGLARVE